MSKEKIVIFKIFIDIKLTKFINGIFLKMYLSWTGPNIHICLHTAMYPTSVPSKFSFNDTSMTTKTRKTTQVRRERDNYNNALHIMYG